MVWQEGAGHNRNAFVERFNHSFREELLNAWLFCSVTEAQQPADDWLTDYDESRPHKALANLQPAIFIPRVFNQKFSILGFLLDGADYAHTDNKSPPHSHYDHD